MPAKNPARCMAPALPVFAGMPAPTTVAVIRPRQLGVCSFVRRVLDIVHTSLAMLGWKMPNGEGPHVYTGAGHCRGRQSA